MGYYPTCTARESTGHLQGLKDGGWVEGPAQGPVGLGKPGERRGPMDKAAARPRRGDLIGTSTSGQDRRWGGVETGGSAASVKSKEKNTTKGKKPQKQTKQNAKRPKKQKKIKEAIKTKYKQ